MATLYIFEIIVGIGLLIFVHELGHFLTAKLFGVKVDKFALGMGPRIFWWQRGETEYSLRAIPIGGFVMLAGEEPGAPPSPEPWREIRNKPAPVRALVFVAGSIMNVITGVIFFTIVFGVGKNFTQPVVGALRPGWPAQKAGLKPGDRILAIEGETDPDFEDVMVTTMLSTENTPLKLKVLRPSTGREFDVVIRPRLDRSIGLPVMGIEPATGHTVSAVADNSPAQAAGLRVDDVIRKADGLHFLNWTDFETIASRNIGKQMQLFVTRGADNLTVTLFPRPTKRGSLGVLPRDFPLVQEVFDNQPASRAGVKVGDRIQAIDGRPTPTVEDIISLTARSAGEPMRLTVKRGGETENLTVTPEVPPGECRAQIGIAIERSKDFTVGQVIPGSAADRAGVKPGDVLVRLGRYSLEDRVWDQLVDAVPADREFQLFWKSGKAEFHATVRPDVVYDDLLPWTGITVTPTLEHLRKYPFWTAAGVGMKKSWQVIEQIYAFLRGAAERRIGADAARGPIGIATISYQAAERGPITFIFLLALIGVNLGVVNLLPVLPLDGGLLVVVLIESITRKRFSEKWLMRLQLIGWALLILLIVVISYHDIVRLIKGLAASAQP